MQLFHLMNPVTLGTIFGDMLGDRYEHPPSVRTTDINFPLYPEGTRFTDDSVMFVALQKYLLECRKNGKADLAAIIRDFFFRYPGRGYGKQFQEWCKGSDNTNSFGNGAAMRIAAVAYAAESRYELEQLVRQTTAVTHTHPLAMENAMVTAIAVYEAVYGSTKEEIAHEIEKYLAGTGGPMTVIEAPHKYDIFYSKNEPVSKSFPSVPQAIACFLYTDSAGMAMRQAVACARDADTQAAIAGSVSLPFYRSIEREYVQKAPDLSSEFVDIIGEFAAYFSVPTFTVC